jgi:hypothetical protein
MDRNGDVMSTIAVFADAVASSPKLARQFQKDFVRVNERMGLRPRQDVVSSIRALVATVEECGDDASRALDKLLGRGETSRAHLRAAHALRWALGERYVPSNRGQRT